MPFVIAPELATVVAAVFLTLLCIGVVYLLTAISRALPKISFLFVHIDFGAIFSAIVKPVISLLTAAATGLMAVVEAIFRAIAWLATELFNGIKDVLGLHAAQIAHIYNEAGPAVGRHAVSQSTSYTNHQVANIGQEIAAARSDFGKIAAADSRAALAKAETSVGALRHTLTAALATGVRAAERYTDREVTNLRDHVQRQLDAIPKPRTVTRVLPGTTTTITRPVTTVVEGGATTVVEGATVADLAGVQVAVKALQDEFDNCAVTRCAGPGNLQNLLGDALGIVDLAAAGAFLSAIISNPAAAEADYAAVIQGLITTGESAFSALLSL